MSQTADGSGNRHYGNIRETTIDWQQRVNIARGFMGQHQLLLLDKPIAALDAINRAVVLSMIPEQSGPCRHAWYFPRPGNARGRSRPDS